MCSVNPALSPRQQRPCSLVRRFRSVSMLRFGRRYSRFLRCSPWRSSDQSSCSTAAALPTPTSGGICAMLKYWCKPIPWCITTSIPLPPAGSRWINEAWLERAAVLLWLAMDGHPRHLSGHAARNGADPARRIRAGLPELQERQRLLSSPRGWRCGWQRYRSVRARLLAGWICLVVELFILELYSGEARTGHGAWYRCSSSGPTSTARG